MQDPYDLQRFVAAQEPVFEQVCAELRRGRKATHWMWFIFPQVEGLGHSAMAQRYAIRSRAEAAAYLLHPLLGERLRACTQRVNAVEGRTIEQIFGSPDDLKFHSSMTLFAWVGNDSAVFSAAVQKYFSGRLDRRTLELLEGGRPAQ
jgi:uncharacterized protein (DUF1810 family)